MPREQNGRPKPRIRLAVTPKPSESASILSLDKEAGTLIMRGPGRLIMECGGCGTPLLEGVEVHQVQSMVFLCNNCGAYNKTLD